MPCDCLTLPSVRSEAVKLLDCSSRCRFVPKSVIIQPPLILVYLLDRQTEPLCHRANTRKIQSAPALQYSKSSRRSHPVTFLFSSPKSRGAAPLRPISASRYVQMI